MKMLKILIVDDDPFITELMKMLIGMEGHQPTTINDSTKAFEAAESILPDLITLDLMMPGISGFELCEMLHNDSRFTNTPILVVSAKDDPASRERALTLGASGYITKPFTVDELMGRINELTSQPSA